MEKLSVPHLHGYRVGPRICAPRGGSTLSYSVQSNIIHKTEKILTYLEEEKVRLMPSAKTHVMVQAATGIIEKCSYIKALGWAFSIVFLLTFTAVIFK